MKRLSLVILIVLEFTSCKETPSTNKFADPVLMKIADLKDRRSSDSLYSFFTNEKAAYREEAALAFASIQDSAAVQQLKKLLSDEHKGVRKAAAFALGQTASRQSSQILIEALAGETDSEIINEILEAYGKVTRRWNLPVSTEDTLKAKGFAWSLYRAGLNGYIDSTLNPIAANLLKKTQSTSTRLGSAHFFFQRCKEFRDSLTACFPRSFR
jgi:hypothetical protein